MLEYLKEILAESYTDEIGNAIQEKFLENFIEKNSMDEKINEITKTHKDEIKQMRLQNAIDSALSISGARNMKAVYALLDKDKLEFDESGQIMGLNEQIQGLKKSDSFLFEKNQVKGLSPAIISETAYKSPKEMNYNELCEYLKTKNNV